MPKAQGRDSKTKHTLHLKVSKKISGRNFFPHVIEPSFGVGRILYAILEQNYYTRNESTEEEADKSKKGDVKRAVLSLPPHLAPVQVWGEELMLGV